MDERDFSIIEFSYRTQDVGKTEGMGNDKDFKWTLKGEELQKRSLYLIDSLNSIENNLKSLPDGVPQAIEVKFIDDAKAKTHQKNIIGMFHVNNATGQIGMTHENKLLLKIDNEKSLKNIISNFSEAEKFRNPISAVKEITTFKPTILFGEEQDENYKINFIDYQDKAINDKVINYVEEKLTEYGIYFNEHIYNVDEQILELSEVTLDKLKFIKELPIKSLEPVAMTDHPFPVLDSLENVDWDSVIYDSSKEYPLIGLLDSGVTINRFTDNWVSRGKGSMYQESELDTNHGTFISTLLIHGNTFNSSNDYSIEGCKIIDVPVVPAFSIKERELITNIRRAVEQNLEVKIWNLSISITGTITRDKFSDFAVALDQIQDEFGVIICKSAGNDSASYLNGLDPKPLSVGAESVRSLTVGSIARSNDPYNFSKKNYPSPYSRLGRAPGEIIKPEVVHYGGDIFSKIANPLVKNDYDIVGEKSILANGEFFSQPGTSFSTPKVAKNLAELNMGLNGEFNPLLLKTLLVHSASYNENPVLDGMERLKKIGYGKPRNSEKILLQNSAHSATLILQGNLRKGQRIDIMDFPFPQNLIEDGHFKGQIKATLIYKNYLERDLGPEYCQSNIEFKFGTYDEKIDRDISKNHILNPIGRSNTQNFLLNSLYSKRNIEKNTDFANERSLIQYGDKYYPVKKFSADLSDMKDSVRGKSLKDNRNWYLYLEGQYRDFIVNKAIKRNKTLSMDFCLAITISDPDIQEDIYAGTLSELARHNFDYQTLNISNEIRLDIDNVEE